MASIDNRLAEGMMTQEKAQEKPPFLGGTKMRNYVQFCCPTDGGKCVDEIASFVVHVDGIQCSGTSTKSNDYLCMTLELVNCNEHDRVSRAMTIFACVMQNRKDALAKERFMKFLEEYLVLNSALGKAGIYMWYDGMWHHWRWFFLGICADSVAQEEVVEFMNKKMTSYPCWFDDSCKRQRLNIAEYMLQEMNSPSITGSKADLSVLPVAANRLHECCGYRLISFLCHIAQKDDYMARIEEFGSLSIAQKGEVSSLRQFLELFPKNSFTQWIPVVSDPYHMYRWRMAISNAILSGTFESHDDANGDDSFQESFLSSIARDAEVGGDGNTVGGDGNMEIEGDGNTVGDGNVVGGGNVVGNGDTVGDGNTVGGDGNMEIEGGGNVVGDGNTEGGEVITATCLQSLVDRVEETSAVEKDVCEECKAYMGGFDVISRSSRITECEKRLLVPSSHARTIDAMHLVKNVLKVLLMAIAKRSRSKSSKDGVLSSFLSGLTGPAVLTGEAFHVPSWVMDAAVSRLQELERRHKCDFTDPRMLVSSFFSSVRTHDCMVFGFALFSYVFQDSYCVPLVFSAIKIMEGLSLMYCFDGALTDLSQVQAMTNLFLMVFEGESDPSTPSISLHMPVHFSNSIRFSGNAYRNNCLCQERQYKHPKKGLQPGCKPEKRMQKVLVVQSACSIYKERTILEDTFVFSVDDPCDGSFTEWILSSLDRDVFKQMTRWNAYDDSVFYDCDMLGFVSVLDTVVDMIRGGQSLDVIRTTLLSKKQGGSQTRKVSFT